MRNSPSDGIDLRMLRILHTVLVERSVTRAATRLGLQQPAVSAALARLRRQLGDPLLVRSATGMAPTATAQALITPLGELLRQTDTLLLATQPFDPARSEQTLAIAASDYLDPWFLPQLVATIKRLAPGVRLDIQPLSGGLDYRSRLASGEVDVVIGNWMSPPPELHQGRLLGDEVVCLVARHHPAARRRWTLSEWLQAEHVAPTPPAPGTAGVIDDYLAQQGLARRIVVRCPHFGLIPAMVSETLLILTTGRRHCERFVSQLPLTIVAPPLPFPRLQYYQLWHERTHRSPATQWLRQTIRNVAAQLVCAPPWSDATRPNSPSPDARH